MIGDEIWTLLKLNNEESGTSYITIGWKYNASTWSWYLCEDTYAYTVTYNANWQWSCSTLESSVSVENQSDN